MDRYHEISFDDDTRLDHWKWAEEEWADYQKQFSDSDGGEDYPVNIGTSSDVPHEKSFSKSNAQSSGNSSDSSNSGASSSQRKVKKSASQRLSEKFEGKLNQFKIETSQQHENRMNTINSKFNTLTTSLNLSETDLKTIKDGVISNTVQISESKNSFNFLSEKLITTTEKLEKVMESHIDTNNKLDKIMESHNALQNDNKSMREELAVIKE